MSVLIRKGRGNITLTRIGRLAITGFIVALAISLVSTIWSIYIDSFVNNMALVGYIAAGFTVISFFSFFLFIPLIEKVKKSKIYLFTLFLMSITYFLFALNTKFYLFIILAFIITLLLNLRITSFGIIVKDKSSQKHLSRNEGLMYTFFNISWLIGPLIAGYVSKNFGINRIFILSSIFILIGALYFKTTHTKDVNVKKKLDKNFIKNLVDFFKDKSRVKAYFLGGGVNLWWIFIYLFMPLYIIRNNLDTVWVGYFLFAVVAPLILLEFTFAKLAGKIGFKKIFKIGFLIPALLAISCFFISNIYVVLGMLSLASVGLAMVEPTTEAYFFDVVKKKDEPRFYGPYNTTIDVNHFIGEILAATLLIFLSFKFIFLLFGAFMLFFVIISFRIKDVFEKRRKKVD